jgi:hypothetical protein
MRKIAAFILLASTLIGEAAEYYVQYGRLVNGVVVGAGDNNANGLTSATAWKHCPGDPEATGNPASTALEPGDTVYFDPRGDVNGSVYGGSIYVRWSGSAGGGTTNWITYSGTNSAWGSGYAHYSPTNRLTGAFKLADAAGNSAYREYLKFEGFQAYEFGGIRDDDPRWLNDCSVPITTGTGGSFVSGTAGPRGIDINLIFGRKIGTWQNRRPLAGANGAIAGRAISFESARDVRISNSVFFEPGQSAIVFGTSSVGGNLTSDIVITNVQVLRAAWGIDFSFDTGSRATNIQILNSRIGDQELFDNGNWLGCGRNLTTGLSYDNPHTDGIFFRAVTGATDILASGVLISGNVFAGDDWQNSGGGTGSIFISKTPIRAVIRNNIFLRDKKNNGNIHFYDNGMPSPSGSYQEVYIVNNTFYGGSRPVGMGTTLSGGTLNTNRSRIVHFYNNLVANPSTTTLYQSILYNRTSSAGGTYVLNMDYNVFWRTASTSRDIVYYNNDYRTQEELIALGYNSHGWLTTNAANPGVVAGWTNLPASMADFRPTATSPLKGAGLDFGVTNFFGVPLKGKDRHANDPDASVNIGAFHGDENSARTVPWTHSADIPYDGNLRTYNYGDPDGNPGSIQPPTAPTSISANLFTDTQALVTWSDVDEETSYKVERKTGAGSWVQVATVAANVVSYSDSPLIASKTYSYRVRASNGGGNSPYSSEVSVTTPAAPTQPPPAEPAPPSKYNKGRRR